MTELNPLKRMLEHYSSKSTKATYRSAIRSFLDTVYDLERDFNIGFGTEKEKLQEMKRTYGQYAERYLEECREEERDKDQRFQDIDDFLLILKQKGKSYNTIDSYLNGIRSFFRWNRVHLKRDDWKILRDSLKSRFESPGAETRDRAPTKHEVNELLKFMGIKMKAITLMLVSSGMRVGELLDLEYKSEKEFPSLHNNIKFTDPPTIFIPDVKSKTKKSPKVGKYGERGHFTFISTEAKEALLKWIDYKEADIGGDGWSPSVRGENWREKAQQMKRSSYIFPINVSTIRQSWNLRLKKAGLDEKSNGTFILHLHTTRKFFRTQIAPEIKERSIWESYLGHTGYLDNSYRRYSVEELRNFYKDAEDAVTIGKRKDRLKKLEEEVETLKTDKQTYQEKVDQLKQRLDKRNGEIKKLRQRLHKETTASNANVAKAIFNVLDVEDEKVEKFEEKTGITIPASEIDE